MHQIGWNDGGRTRSICYRAAVSEMLVPYADPSTEWQWREFFDEGEYGLGTLSSESQPGEQVPLNATTLDVTLASESLEPETYAKRVFVYERSDGSPLCLFQQGTAAAYAQSKELRIGFTANLGNYQYLYRWVFREDGSFGFECDLQVNQDDVVWYTMGFTHLTKQEDFPLISEARLSVNFVPHNFFERAPFLDRIQIDPNSNAD